MKPEVLGWASSLILIATLLKQLYKQWTEETSRGVSKWLYIGQMGANAGFLAYSWLLGNAVFAVTNGILLLSSVLGLGITLRHRRRAARQDRQPGSAEPGARAGGEPLRGQSIRHSLSSKSLSQAMSSRTSFSKDS